MVRTTKIVKKVYIIRYTTPSTCPSRLLIGLVTQLQITCLPYFPLSLDLDNLDQHFCISRPMRNAFLVLCYLIVPYQLVAMWNPTRVLIHQFPWYKWGPTQESKSPTGMSHIEATVINVAVVWISPQRRIYLSARQH